MEIKCSGKAQKIYEKVKPKLKVYGEQGKMQIKEVAFDDDRYEATASGTGFKAKIQCRDDCVIVDLDLNFLLRPIRATIEDGIRQGFSKILEPV